MPPRGLSDISA
uniref:Uncharacterized protein n=1 Tax=Arundo donax TaxID=35708 RepID=A0A0A9EKL4_ARUDO